MSVDVLNEPGNEYLVLSDSMGDGTVWRLTWYFPDEQEEGGWIGDEHGIEARPEPERGSEDWRVWRAVKVALECGATYDSHGLCFEEKSAGTKALRRIKAEWKAAESEVPWPEWALKAVSEGFKPPKCWKPKRVASGAAQSSRLSSTSECQHARETYDT